MLSDWALPRPAQHVSQNQSHNNRIIKLTCDRHKVRHQIDRHCQIEN
jgi:hypothetical protein